MSAPAFTSASAVSVWPFTDAQCSAVTLHSQTRHSCRSTPSRRTVRPDTAATGPTQGCSLENRTRRCPCRARLRPPWRAPAPSPCGPSSTHSAAPSACTAKTGIPAAPPPSARTVRPDTVATQRHDDAATRIVPVVVLAVHVCARCDQRHRRLRVAIQRRTVKCRPPAQPNSHSCSSTPSGRTVRSALWQPNATRMQARGTVPVVVLAVHVRARRDQRHRRLHVAFDRRPVQRRPPAQPTSHSCRSTPECTDRPPRHCGNPTDTRMQPRESYPCLSLQCMSAPAVTSAIAVAVWPFSDAPCSAVLLHSQTATRAAPPSEWTDRPPRHCGKPTDNRMLPRETVPIDGLAVNVRARVHQRRRRRRMAVPRSPVQRRPPAQPNRHSCSSTPSGRTGLLRQTSDTRRQPESCTRPLPWNRTRTCPCSARPRPSQAVPPRPLCHPLLPQVVGPCCAHTKDYEPLNNPPRRAQAEWTQTHLLAVPIGPSGVLSAAALFSTGHSAVLGGGVSGAREELQPATGRSKTQERGAARPGDAEKQQAHFTRPSGARRTARVWRRCLAVLACATCD
jgi:hypothetical protein